MNNIFTRAYNFITKRDVLDLDGNKYMYYGGTNSGVTVTPEKAGGLATVFACVEFVANSIATLPKSIYERKANGRGEAIKNDQYLLFKHSPSKLYTSEIFHKTIITQMLLFGNSYAEIIRNGNGRPIEYRIIHPNCIEVRNDERIGIHYWNIEESRVIMPENILHFMDYTEDGIIGKSRITVMREQFGEAIAARDFGSKFFRNGLYLSGAIKTDKKMTPRAIMTMKREFKNSHEDGDITVLEHGMDFKQFENKMPLSDAKYIESRNFHDETICRMFGIPPHVVGLLGKMSFNNIYEMQINAVNNGLRPRSKMIAAEFNRKVFRPSEFSRLYVHYEYKGLLEGDPQTRAEVNKIAFEHGALNRNEWRALEGNNPIPGGDEYYLSHNLIPTELAGKHLLNNSNGKQES